MASRLLAVAALSVFAATAAHAQSNYIDLSKPMTGKSSYVVNHDGSPVERGVVTVPKLQPKAQETAQQPVWNGAAPVQEARDEPVAFAGQQRAERRRRSGGTTVVVVGGSKQADNSKTQPQRTAQAQPQAKPKPAPRIRMGRRGR